ncbi:DUF1801 domain-containing protein [Arthrobacter sp. NPDC093128]|uniref:DUF1801 domain-containing protein n=1 Tax=Arthrobacter sp. NPDC093128 TaxID=3154979 RepID=UPI003415768C
MVPKLRQPAAGDLVASVREFILATDPAVTEAIKWQAPTFMYKGNIASSFPSRRKP